MVFGLIDPSRTPTAANGVAVSDPNLLSTADPGWEGPFSQDGQIVSNAWISQGVKAMFPKGNIEGQDGAISVAFAVKALTPTSTWTVQVWRFIELTEGAGFWSQPLPYSSISGRGNDDFAVGLDTAAPILLLVTECSDASVAIYGDLTKGVIS